MTVTTPIVVDLGRASETSIELLREGGGPLIDDVEEAIGLVRQKAGEARSNRIFVPIVVVYTGASENSSGRDIDGDGMMPPKRG
jgi:hypothetical protein